jgi:hypothetical protein
MAGSLARGHAVEFVLADTTRRGRIYAPARDQPGSWIVLGTDGASYIQPADHLTPLTGSAARETTRLTKILLMRGAIRRQLEDLLTPPQMYVPAARDLTHDSAAGRETEWRLPRRGPAHEDGRESAGLDIPSRLHDRDDYTAVGLDWCARFEHYLDRATGPYFHDLKALYKQDPRLKAVWILCVEQGFPSHLVGEELGCSRMTAWRLTERAKVIMGDRRDRRVS